ncbi:MAG: hypothetical protein RR595_04325 [Lysinibacillus sp.]
MGQLSKAAFICGSGSMIILVSILIKLPFFIQILLLLTGLTISVFGVFKLIKTIGSPAEKAAETFVKTTPTTTTKKNNRPTSTL